MPHCPFFPDMSAGPKGTFLLAESSHGTLLKKAAASSWPEISMQYKVLSHSTSGLKPVGSILILLVAQKARLQEEHLWTQNIFCQWQSRHYELHWSMNQSLFLAEGKALRVHSIHSRSTWGPRTSQRWNYNSSVMPVLKGLSLPWVTPHEEDVILAGHYQLCKLKTWKISSSKRIIKNWGNLVCPETFWQDWKVFHFPASISMLENQE